MTRWRDGSHNPEFPTDRTLIDAERRRMRASPRALPRPVIVLAGWRSPRLQGFGLTDKLAPLTSGRAEDFIRIAYPLAGDFDRAVSVASTVIASRLTERAAAGPVEVDVIGISMGGLVARIIAARAGSGDGPVFKVRRLFTIATPHSGAKLADFIAPDQAARMMRRGSDLLRTLDEQLPTAGFELICYSQLRDWWVGAKRTAPHGGESHWIDARTPVDYVFSHFTSPRRWPIVVDIARRLRDESPLAGRPSVPPRD